MKWILWMIVYICLVIMVVVIREMWKYIQKLATKSSRMERYHNMLNKWLEIKNEKILIGDYLQENEFYNIAIYGMGIYGINLLYELQENESVRVLYGIDRAVDNVDGGIRVYKPEEELPEVDLVIVTAIMSYDSIKQLLVNKMNCPIISLERLIEEI